MSAMHNIFSRLANSIRLAVYNRAINGNSLLAKMVFRSPPPNLSQIPDISVLSPAVIRILGQNPGPFTLQGTNTYLLGTGNDRILIDTGEPKIPSYIEKIAETLKQNSANISAIIITHWHFDHIGGVESIIKKFSNRKIPIYKLRRRDGTPEHYQIEINYVEDGHMFKIDGATLRLIYTPGHTSDHAALLFIEENAIFSGDCILGEGTAIFDDLHSYMITLRKLLELKPSKIYPGKSTIIDLMSIYIVFGHGKVVDNAEEKIREYISHREKRETQIYEALRKAGKQGLTPMMIVAQLYPEISVKVRVAAMGNVNHHLEKLVKESKVAARNGIYSVVEGAEQINEHETSKL